MLMNFLLTLLFITLVGAYVKSLADWDGTEAPAGGGGGGGCLFLLIFGIVVSPSTILTKQYSIRAMNTKIVHTDINASTAFKYDTGGRDAWDLACCVDSVSNDVTPSVTLAGAASGLIQKLTH